MCECILTFIIHYASQPKVPEFAVAIRVQENVSWLEVSVQDFLGHLTACKFVWLVL